MLNNLKKFMWMVNWLLKLIKTGFKGVAKLVDVLYRVKIHDFSRSTNPIRL